MNKELSSFQFVARALRINADIPEHRSFEAEVADGRVDWTQVLNIADNENMTVALATALRRHGLFKMLPQAVRAALSRREIMGTEVGKRLRRQAEDVVRILNGAGVAPLAMKGVLRLFESPADGPAERFMRDFDFVVPADKLAQSIAAMRDAGYVPELQDDRWTYHYHPMHHPDQICAVELHVRPGEQRNFLTAEEAWAAAVAVDHPNLQLIALSPEHRIAHNIFHSEIQDHGFLLGEICLRQLYDLALVCEKFRNEIDWGEIEARMERNGLAVPIRARLHMAASLLGAPVPPKMMGALRSRIHLARCLRQMRASRWNSVARWVVGVVSRFSRYRIDLVYGCGTNGAALVTHRIKYAWKILRQHRGHLGTRILEHGRRLR